MAQIVKIKNAGSGKYLNIYGNNVTSLTPHQNVTIWEDSNSNEQKWQIPDTNIIIPRVVAPIRSVINTSYGLNVYRSGNPYNCDVYPVSGNETDSNIEIDIDLKIAYGKIKLKNYDLYLTAASKANGANVYWAADANSAFQMWRFISEDDEDDGEGNDSGSGSGNTTSKTLTMPQNANQKYSGNQSLNTNMYNQGCAVCCACDLASYYGGRAYSLSEIKAAGVFTTSSISCVWANVPNMSINGDVTSNFLSTIKSEIDQNRPVLVKYGKTTDAGAGHWVVAFKYVNSASNYESVYVLDPAGADNESQGKVRTLQQAMEWSELDKIDILRKTKKKN